MSAAEYELAFELIDEQSEDAFVNRLAEQTMEAAYEFENNY